MDKVKPRLKNIDDLFGIGADIPSDAEYAIVPFDLMDDYPDHQFRLYTGEREADMVESIKTNGIMQPLILRVVDADSGRYQVLSGHNRKNCGRKAGLTEAPAVIKRDLTDDEAWAYVVETNLHQRGFSELSHSEKAAVLALHHNKMFSQGKRNDIQNELKMLENPHGDRGNSTYSQVANKLTTISKVGQEYGLAKDTVARYLRINQLILALKIRLDSGGIPFIPAVTLSFLKEAEQELIENCIKLNKFKVDIKKADTLRQYSEKSKLDSDNIYLILSGEAVLKKKASTPTIKVSKAVYSKYFKPSQPAKEVQEIVEKALDMYFGTKE